FSLNETILSGDLDQNDGSNDLTGNSYHVIDNSANGLSSSAILDGFTISGGNADGTNPFESDGGGMLNVNSSPLVSNCIFKDNQATQGAGTFNASASPEFTNCRWEDNIASTSGGAVHNDLADSDFINCAFSSNQSNQDGGGIANFNMSSPTFTNCGFVDNQAVTNGGGIYNSNGITSLLLNTSFAENTAGSEGGAVYNETNVELEIANSLLWDNSANNDNTTASASIFSDATSTTTVTFSSIQNSGGSLSWNTALGVDGGANIEEDPLFSDLINGNVTLPDFSPVIDAGDSSRVSVDFDIADNPRIDCADVDMGAFEVSITPFMGDIIYVDASKIVGTNDGTSWANAFVSLQDALSINCGTFTQIWVAKGTYYPDEGAGQMDNRRRNSFEMKNELAIYGGFVGNEPPTFDLTMRDFELNETILSGDIDQNDNAQDSTGNSYHVLLNFNTGLDSTAILDGFTISSANSDGERFEGIGGGMFNLNASPTIRNCIFRGHKSGAGSGIYNYVNSSPTIDNCLFEDNETGFSGGAMLNNSQSSPIISNSFFQNNTADRGGAIVNTNSSFPTFINCVIFDNTASNGGAMLNSVLSSPEIVNASIVANKAMEDGGALYSELGASPSIINSIIWGNEANGTTDSTSASIFLLDQTGGNPSNPQISYSLIAVSGGSGSDWNTEMGTDNGDNLDVDPLFLDQINGDLRVQAGSYAIDNGENTANSTTKDIAGEDRFVSTIDLGAYEASPISINIKAFLEGPYVSQSTSMTTQLTAKNLLPLTEPFTALGYTFVSGGGEMVLDTSIFTVNNIVDWVFIELRSGADNQEVVATRAALLKSNGDIVEVDGQSPLRFLDPGLNTYFVVVQHRSHLGVMSDNTLTPVGAVLPSIDFTNPATPTFSTTANAQKEIAGRTVLISGDADQNGVVNSDDINNEWFLQNGQPFNYLNSTADFNLDGEVNAVDYNLYLLINLLLMTQVP
ncbi:MAG: right-handed parallel beta-helix repeat-containing protein, partial [Bacteroidota bacterium]